MKSRIRVLVVDDSAFSRKVLREVLITSPDIEVVGTARDGLEALEKVAALKPDVMTLDLVMPNLDGIGVLRELPAEGPPRVVVVSTSNAESELGIAALEAGAVDLVRKPTALATAQLYELGEEIVRKVVAAAHARPISLNPPPSVGVRASVLKATRQVVVVGASTGGPQALTRLLADLPGDFPVPLVIALHIPPGYTEALAKRLDEHSKIQVVEAEPDLVLRPGCAVIARGGQDLRLFKVGTSTHVRLGQRRALSMLSPSVDLLFESAAEQFGKATLGVVLTGMGDDGLKGSRAIVAAGGHVLTEAESSCVIYGMPRCVKEAGYATAEAPLHAMAAEIAAHL